LQADEAKFSLAKAIAGLSVRSRPALAGAGLSLSPLYRRAQTVPPAWMAACRIGGMVSYWAVLFTIAKNLQMPCGNLKIEIKARKI
jgi:hypothetical protein